MRWGIDESIEKTEENLDPVLFQEQSLLGIILVTKGSDGEEEVGQGSILRHFPVMPTQRPKNTCADSGPTKLLES